MDVYDEAELFFVKKSDLLRDRKYMRIKNEEMIEKLRKSNKISPMLTNSFKELLDINPAAYWPKSYRYTIEPRPGYTSKLTVKQRDQYEKNGFLIIKNLIPNNLLNLVSNCPKTSLTDILPLIINYNELVLKAQAFCGQQAKHIATLVIDDFFSQLPLQNKQNDYSELTAVNQLSQFFYQLNVYPADRLVAAMICLEKTEEINLSICLEPATHQSARLEVEMRGIDGELVKNIYEKPIRTLDSLNENSETRKLITLQPGDVFFYHPLLAQSIVFDQNIENFRQNTDIIYALNIFYGSNELTKIIRSWGSRYINSASVKTTLNHLMLLDENEQQIEIKDETIEEEMLMNNQNLSSVKIYTGSSITDLKEFLADVELNKNSSEMKSLL